MEYGATWQNEFNDTVTHIITDRDYDYPQLLKYLKISELPVSHASILAQTGFAKLTEIGWYCSSKRKLPIVMHGISQAGGSVEY